MKKMLYTFLIGLIVVGISSTLIADDELPYIRMGVGAKALSMGGAYTAVADNVTASYWNPAGLASIDCFELGSMYSANMGLDREYNYIGIARIFSFGTIALSWINAGWKDFQGTSGNYDVMDNNISLSYGSQLFKTLSIGLSAKAYTQDIISETESGFGFDAGLLYQLHPQVSIGLMIRDFVSSFGDDDLPYQANAGIAIKPFNFYKKQASFLFNNVTIAGDLRKEQDDSHVKFGVGLDYNVKWKEISDIDAETSIRFGSNDGNFTTGLGILYKMLEFNYAFTTDTSEDKIFEDSHRLSLIVRF